MFELDRVAAPRTVQAPASWRFDPTRQYDQHASRVLGKPVGLWYAFGTSWRDWCVANEFRDPTHPLHRLEVRNPDVVLQLRTLADITAFSREFRDPEYPTFSQIRWGVVAALCAGIELPAYEHDWSLRHKDARWTYGWDCASGCIWDLAAAGVTVAAPLADAAPSGTGSPA